MYYRHKIPFLSIENYELNKEIVRSIPERTCRYFQIIGIDKFEGTGNTKIFTIGMVNPENEKVRSKLEKRTGYTIRPFKIDIESWAKIINEVFSKRINKRKGENK